MFRIEMLPARQGDCLWIEYGKPAREIRRVLIDGGVVSTYEALRAKIARLPPEERRLELLIVTHVDRDHIEGTIKLLGDRRLGLRVEEIWYNGYKHLVGADVLGPLQGEFFSALVQERQIPWNTRFGGGPVGVGTRPIEKRLDGGLKLTVLAPDRRRLERMISVWEKKVLAKDLDPGDAEAALTYLRDERPELVPRDLLGATEAVDIDALSEAPFKIDRTSANASSIAFLAELDGKTCLFAGDSPPDALLPGLSALGIRRLDAWKLSHHGSKGSTSPRQLATIAADRYLFSTDGSYYDHPDDETIARILLLQQRSRKTLIFNYPLPPARARIWEDSDLRDRFNYDIVVERTVEL